LQGSTNYAPAEYILLSNIERWGVESILDRRILYNIEIISFNYIKRMTSIYHDPERAQNMVTWKERNPEDYQIYTEAKFLAANE